MTQSTAPFLPGRQQHCHKKAGGGSCLRDWSVNVQILSKPNATVKRGCVCETMGESGGRRGVRGYKEILLIWVAVIKPQWPCFCKVYHLPWPVPLSWSECCPMKRKVAGSIPAQGTSLDCGFSLQWGCVGNATDRCFSYWRFPLSPPPLPSL